MINNLKQSLLDYLHALTIYDYGAFGWLLFVMIMLLALSLIFSRKKPQLALYLIVLTMFIGISAPIPLKYFLDKTVRKVEILDQNHTVLNFSKSLVVTGELKNSGKVDFKKCRVSAKVIKIEHHKYKDIMHLLKPNRKKTVLLEGELLKEQTKGFKVIFEDFQADFDFNVTVAAECY